MAVSCSNLLANGSTTGATSYTTASVSPGANHLLLLQVKSRTNITATPNTPTVTGLGLTWVQIGLPLDIDDTGSSRERMTLWRAMGTPTSGALTFDFAGQSQTHCEWLLDELSGTDTSGTNGSGAIVQSATAIVDSNGPAVPSLTATLAIFNNSNDATWGTLGSFNSTTVYTEVSPMVRVAFHQQADGAVISAFDSGNSTTVKWTFNVTDISTGIYALQIRAKVTGLVTKVASISSPTSTGNQSYTGAGFQPKAILAFVTALTADGSAAGIKKSVGFGLSSTSRAAVGDGAVDSTATVNSYDQGHSNAAVIYATDGSGNLFLVADIVSMDSNGVTLNWTTVQASSYIVNIMYIGGADLTNTFISQQTAPVSTGSVAYTNVGFKPDAIIVITSGFTTAPPAHSALGSTPRFSMGFGTSLTAEASGYDGDDNGTTSKIGRKQAANIVEMLSGDAALSSEASLTSLDSDGFTFNWTTAGSARYFWVLCLKGGRYKVSTFTQKTSTGSQPTTGVGFNPTGLILQSVDNTASSSVVTNGRYSLGIGNDSTHRGSIWVGNADGQTTLNNSQNLDRSNIIKMMTESHSTPTTQAAADLTSLDSDGFTLSWGTADATAREIIYFAMGSNAASTNHLLSLLGVGS